MTMKLPPRTIFIPLAALLLLSAPARPEYRRETSAKLEFLLAPGSPIAVGPMAGRPAVGDCNGDGHPDIVVACGTC
jgi:hypothetical protein